jgi:hypothetical protein
MLSPNILAYDLQEACVCVVNAYIHAPLRDMTLLFEGMGKEGNGMTS